MVVWTSRTRLLKHTLLGFSGNLFLLVCGHEKLDKQNQKACVERSIERQSFCPGTPALICSANKVIPQESWCTQETAHHSNLTRCRAVNNMPLQSGFCCDRQNHKYRSSRVQGGRPQGQTTARHMQSHDVILHQRARGTSMQATRCWVGQRGPEVLQGGRSLRKATAAVNCS